MKKKVFSLFLSVLMIISIVAALPASAAVASKGNIYNGQFHGTLELKMSPTLRVGEKISGAIDVNGYPLRFTGDAGYFGYWRDKTLDSKWFKSGELNAQEGHEYEYTVTLMYSNIGDVRFDDIDGVTVNGVPVDCMTAEDDDVIRIYVPYDAYVEVRNCVEVVHGNQWFIPGESATFRSKLGPADANNHLSWVYYIVDEPYEHIVKNIYAYDHPFFVITVQNDYPDDTVSVSKFTCTPETDKAVAATCTKTGLTEGSHCQYCKKVLTEQKVTPKINCKPVIDKAVAATCTKSGLTEGSHCEVCKKVLKEQKVVPATGHHYIPSEEPFPSPQATMSKDGRLVSPQVCEGCDDEYEKTSVIPKIGTVKLIKTSGTYNGKVQYPDEVIKDRTGKALKGGEDYNVFYPKRMKNVGKYTIKIVFKEYYDGSKYITYNINPKGTSVSKVTATKKGFKVKWKKQATQTTGYQVQYSTSSKFKKGNKTVNITKNKTTSKSIKKLAAKKRYYVRVRTYKTVKVNGKNVKLYSGWSKAKKVTTKR